jgi:hypothetical protein
MLCVYGDFEAARGARHFSKLFTSQFGYSLVSKAWYFTYFVGSDLP